MSLNHGKSVILRLIDKKPEIGKTAVMKCIFFLQKAFGMKLGYPFEIYTYGPYSSDVSEDLDSLSFNNLISSEIYTFNNFSAYKLTAADNATRLAQAISDDDNRRLDRVLELFGSETVKKLELFSTILYFADLYERI